jgi:hypothetical protein
VRAFTDQPLLAYLGNSAIVAFGATVLSLVVSSAAAYAIARLNLRHRQLVLTAIVASSMFPLVTLLVPIFETMRTLGLLNTYTALVLPYVVLNLPVCTLVLVSFFQSIPRDLENAAMIDGCTRLGALVRVVRAAGRAGRLHGRHPGLRQRLGRVPARPVAQRQCVHADLAGGHHAVPGRVQLPVAHHLGRADRGHRAGGGADRAVPGARGGRAHARRTERVKP